MKTLLIVDMQNDFMPWGSLPVPKGDEIIPIINALMPKFSLVLATQDWHPKDHVSFAINHPDKEVGDIVRIDGVDQILWPVHCVHYTKGSELVDQLNKGPIATIFFKGTDKMIDSYSTFYDNARAKSTGLGDYLKTRGIQEIYIAGVATDYCVLYSVLDALDLGLKVKVVTDACRGINLHQGDEKRAFERMQAKGAELITSKEITQ